MGTLSATTQLTVVQCWCGVLYAVPDSLYSEYDRKNNKAPQSMSLYCPLGHAMVRGVSSELTEARAELKRKTDEVARKQAALDQAWARSNELRGEVAHQERRINGYKGVVARTKRRISKGRCPCCSHEFKNLKQHMQAEHPHWDPDKGAEALST